MTPCPTHSSRWRNGRDTTTEPHWISVVVGPILHLLQRIESFKKSAVPNAKIAVLDVSPPLSSSPFLKTRPSTATSTNASTCRWPRSPPSHAENAPLRQILHRRPIYQSDRLVRQRDSYLPQYRGQAPTRCPGSDNPARRMDCRRVYKAEV
ncbi:hypothetical protein AOQ84DRAFT_35993 [Glonium stellatum]|uniref:Uncharacterized protein n=1 Tax=Glonium stellatum TaxID=574774 RepID=A0A8E2FGC1_9PEZI|nr:hypothetical protein AOQ84DRAFT_35993 [Glonium stellatum]